MKKGNDHLGTWSLYASCNKNQFSHFDVAVSQPTYLAIGLGVPDRIVECQKGEMS
jgi:hypothetical protein